MQVKYKQVRVARFAMADFAHTLCRFGLVDDLSDFGISTSHVTDFLRKYAIEGE